MSRFILSLFASLAVCSMGDDRTTSTIEYVEEAILVADDACSDRASAECGLEFLQLRGAQTTDEIKESEREHVTADFCCYAGSGADKCGSCYPGSRAEAGSFCDSEDKCGVCGGTWCTMKCVYSSVNPHDVCGTAYKSAVAADGEFCAESEERCIGCGGSWCGMEAEGARENEYVKLEDDSATGAHLSDIVVDPEKKLAKAAEEPSDDYDYYEEPEAESEDESEDEAEISYDYAEQVEEEAEEPAADLEAAKAESGDRTEGVTSGSVEAQEDEPGAKEALYDSEPSMDNSKHDLEEAVPQTVATNEVSDASKEAQSKNAEAPGETSEDLDLPLDNPKESRDESMAEEPLQNSEKLQSGS